MLRVFKVTSPMSMGSWLLGGFVPATAVAAASAWTGKVPRLGTAATAVSALLGPAVATYTAVLVSNTAVPAWHDGHRELPFVFAGSAAMAAGGLGLLAAPAGQNAPARNLALLGAGAEAVAFERMTKRMGMVGEPYSADRAGSYHRASQALLALGVAGALLGRRHRVIAALSAGTVVVEAGVRSGALNTARHARRLGRQVLADALHEGRVLAVDAGKPALQAADFLDGAAGLAVEVAGDAGEHLGDGVEVVG